MPMIEKLATKEYKSKVKHVDYEFQKEGNQMMITERSAI